MNEGIIKEIRKEVLVEILKRWIRCSYPPVVAELHCHQIDDTKYFVKMVELMLRPHTI